MTTSDCSHHHKEVIKHYIPPNRSAKHYVWNMLDKIIEPESYQASRSNYQFAAYSGRRNTLTNIAGTQSAKSEVSKTPGWPVSSTIMTTTKMSARGKKWDDRETYKFFFVTCKHLFDHVFKSRVESHQFS